MACINLNSIKAIPKKLSDKFSSNWSFLPDNKHWNSVWERDFRLKLSLLSSFVHKFDCNRIANSKLSIVIHRVESKHQIDKINQMDLSFWHTHLQNI